MALCGTVGCFDFFEAVTLKLVIYLCVCYSTGGDAYGGMNRKHRFQSHEVKSLSLCFPLVADKY